MAFLAIIYTVTFVACGENKEHTKTKGDVSQVEEVKSVSSKPQMTLENASKLEFERVSLLMNKYWVKFKGKDYADVKDIYAKFKDEDNKIFQKFGVTNKQSYTYWKRDHKSELHTYRKTHPQYDFYVKFPEYKKALITLYHFDEAKRHSK